MPRQRPENQFQKVLFQIDINSESSIYQPLKIGIPLKAPIGPWLENCPRADSRKKIGRPAMISIRQYGTRNAPEKYNENGRIDSEKPKRTMWVQ